MKKVFKYKEPYSIFANVYNKVMGHVDYKKWAKFLFQAIEPQNPLNTLDIACGTGSLFQFYPSYLKKIGIDSSNEMIQIAKINSKDSEFYVQNMKKICSNEKFDFVTCTHDSINYLLTKEELEEHFISVKNILKNDSIYFFDISSEENILLNFDKKIFTDTIDHTFLLWENEYDKDKREIYSKLFFSINTDQGLFEFRETHQQKCYQIDEIEQVLNKTGFKILGIGSDYNSWKQKRGSSLINFMVKQI